MKISLKEKSKFNMADKYDAYIVGDYADKSIDSMITINYVDESFVIRVSVLDTTDIDYIIHNACVDIGRFVATTKCKSLLIDANTFYNGANGLSYIANVFMDELCVSSVYDSLNAVIYVDFGNNVLSDNKNKRLKEEINLVSKTKPIFSNNQDNGDWSPDEEINVLLNYEYNSNGQEGTTQERFVEFYKDFASKINFKDYLLNLIKQKGFKKYSQVYNAAGIPKDTFYKIIDYSRSRKPSKETVASLTIGLKLDLQEAQEFYNMAGYSLTTWDFVDILIRFFINESIYNIDCVNDYYLRETGRLLSYNSKDSNVITL